MSCLKPTPCDDAIESGVDRSILGIAVAGTQLRHSSCRWHSARSAWCFTVASLGCLLNLAAVAAAPCQGASTVEASLNPAMSEIAACMDPEIAGYIKTSAGRIWYRINGTRHLGTGRPALIALHGGPGGNHRSVAPLIALSDRYPVILYDQIDSGHSDRPNDPRNWSVEQFADEIEAVRVALGLTNVVVLGHSAGAAWATVYAARRPAGLRGVILASPLVSTATWLHDANVLRAKLPSDIQNALSSNEAAGTTRSEEYLHAVDAYNDRHLCHGPCPKSCFAQNRPAFNDALYEYMWGPNEFTATGVLASFDATANLRSIEPPVLLICGEFDEARPETCAHFAAMAPHGRARIVSGAAHMTAVEQPDAFVREVRGFLDSVAYRPGP